ncbi:MAG: Elongation factor Ts [candidate division WS6 bacterium GW2011_GWF2_39_15]|uniref:Elongation factor Ts n=1 Tax=candidate division WS6 bacterium GW2011_GWF2_39_15 TaxID=1619100 RepID=A0A0G0MT60_9BACT|nr:MAG: Elongation factor Ts [candidate division WS6 bacterium GW2011_GWF2_39_15]
MAYTLDDIKMLRAKTSAGMALCKEALESSKGDMEKAVAYINSKSDVVSRLRNLTGAKIGLCKLALEDAGNDFEKAVEIINERGWNDPVGNDTSEKTEGIIDAYVHGIDKRLVSVVEVTCKTDFVARNDGFKAFVHEIALQVAAMKPAYISKEAIPQEKIDELKVLFERELKEEGKPENMLGKIVEGKFSKYYSENCLLEQKWFKDESKTIKSLLDEHIQKLGEPLAIRRIMIWELGK